MNPKTQISHHPKDLVLDHYHCTFFLPLIGLEQDFEAQDEHRFYYGSQDNPNLADEEAQAYRYFSPSLRNILFDCKNSPNGLQTVKEWRLKEEIIQSWQLHLGKTEDEDNPAKYQRSKIVSVRLFQYFNGIYLLAVRVEPEALRGIKNDFDQPQNTVQEWIQADSQNANHYRQLVMEDWLHFTRHVRLIYPSFPQQNDENKIAPIHLIRKDKETVTAFKDKIEKIQIHPKPSHDFSPVISEFLKAFAKEPEKLKETLENYSHFYDDRMFVSVAYGIAGKKLPKASLQRINTLVSHVDRQEAEGFSDMDGYAYTPKVILEKTRKNAFSLWEGLGGYYTYTDFSNTYLSNGADFRTYIAPEHIPHIYDRMLIQALFYQATLRHYDNQICAETDNIIKQDDLKGIRKQRGEFVKFTNQYWFHTVTSQMQGKEIFNLQQQALGIQDHYAILKDELERTDEYLQTTHENRMSDFTDRLTRYGLVFAFIAIYYSILPIINEALKTNTMTLWSWAGQWMTCPVLGQHGTSLTGLLIVLVLIPAVIFLTVNWIMNSKNHDLKS